MEHAGAAPGVPHSAVKRTRVSAAWTALGLGFVILTVLLIFVAQNIESVQLDFLRWQGCLPLGVAILLAAVAGGLLTVAIGSVQIFSFGARHQTRYDASHRLDRFG